MSFNFLEYKENQHLVPVEIQRKKSYYYDLINIEHSFTGRVDAWLANTFIHESVQLIVNAINLFEMGYFDCAYYSLRQSLELSTTMIYLVDIDENKKETELKKWKSEERFPMQAQMMEFLSKNGAVFADFKSNLETYFKHLDSAKTKLNKYVHKQGLDKFYVSRNHLVNGSKSREKFINEFESSLKTCIGAVAVFRLGIDPFPILLNDEEIFHRTGDVMTRAYSEEFIEMYIGNETVECYRNTEIYQGHYDYFLSQEKKDECVTNIVKDQYIDTDKFDEILNQKHLMSDSDLIAVLICKLSDKAVKVYTSDGFIQYFTNRNTARKKMSWDSRDFHKFKECNPPSNIPYDEAFITYVLLNKVGYFVEHNQQFTNKEIGKIKSII
ncbi:MAG: teicoplanin resistance protein VanZ [Deltaproteobacteria bacterium]|nr:teicoplanin resistance protein VanZ [Deltaproteobacteria bacterium]